MSTIDTLDRPTSEPAARHALPDPGASVPTLALPTLGIYFGALTVFVISTIAYIRGLAPAWVTIPANAAVTFWMFTVVHDASHYAISSKRWVNALFGRGTVQMGQNFALGRAELDAGYVLTCQSRPTSPTVSVDYDA
jgi:fatty acid desaturase